MPKWGEKQTDKPVGLVVPLCLWDIMQVGSLLFLRCECMSMGTSVGVCERQRDSEWPSNKNAWADLKILQIFPLTHCNPPSVAWPYYPGGGQGLPNFFAFTSAFTNKAFFFFLPSIQQKGSSIRSPLMAALFILILCHLHILPSMKMCFWVVHVLKVLFFFFFFWQACISAVWCRC